MILIKKLQFLILDPEPGGLVLDQIQGWTRSWARSRSWTRSRSWSTTASHSQPQPQPKPQHTHSEPQPQPHPQRATARARVLEQRRPTAFKCLQLPRDYAEREYAEMSRVKLKCSRRGRHCDIILRLPSGNYKWGGGPEV